MLRWFQGSRQGQGCLIGRSYGSTGRLPVANRRWKWEERGQPWQLLQDAAVAVGRQYAALGVIVLEVFVKFIKNSPKRFMTCDGREEGIPLAALCEGTKSCARFFVLLAMVVSLMVAIRMVLRSRIYYELLRHGAIIDFDNTRPLHDPLFLMLVVCIGLAFLHFVTSWTYSWWIAKPLNEMFSDLKAETVFFFAPTAAFIGFLFRSYDTEADLIPLNKYVEEDPDLARAQLAHIPVLYEDQVVALMLQGLLPGHKGPCTSSDLYEAIIEGAEQRSQLKPAAGVSRTPSTIKNAKACCSEAAEDLKEILSSKPAFITTMWPAQVLLDGRLKDEASSEFRQVWLLLASFAVGVMLFVLGFFAYQVRKDVSDVLEGQVEDLAALAVEAIFFLATAYLLRNLYLIITIR